MPQVLIDTDIAIDYLRGEEALLSVMHRLWRERCAALSVLTVYELTAGMREREKSATKNFIAACRILELSPEIAARGGDLYREYRSRGVTLAPLDCLIADTALEKGFQVATRNVKHYPQKGILADLR